MTAASSMLAMMRNFPPQRAQPSIADYQIVRTSFMLRIAVVARGKGGAESCAVR